MWRFFDSSGRQKIITAEAPTDGWIAETNPLTYASSTTFTVAGDQTTRYQFGTRIKLTQTTAKYFVVTGSSYASGTTTVTVTAGNDYSLANAAITNPYYSYDVSPVGYPAYFSCTPVWTSSGTQPALGNSTVVGQFAVNGETVHYRGSISFGSTATFGTGTYYLGLPIADGNDQVGTCYGYDTSSGNFMPFSANAQTSTTVSLVYGSTYGGGATSAGQTNPWTWAQGDVWSWNFTYQAA